MQYRRATIYANAMLVMQAAGMMFGMWKVGTFNVKRRGWKQEKLEARRALAPYLQVIPDFDGQ